MRKQPPVLRSRLARATALVIPGVIAIAGLAPIPASAAATARVAGTISAISIAAPASVSVGAWQTKLAGVPTSVLGDGPGADGTPVRGVPVRGVPVRGVPVRGVPVRGVPVRGVPVRGVPVRGVPVRGVPVRGVPLSQIPLVPASGLTWPALLAAIPSLANKPLESVSFGDYLDAAPNTALTLGDIDLANSPLRSVPLEGWLLATVPATQIVYPGGSLCDLAKQQTQIAQCDATAVNSLAYDYSPAVPTVLDLALAGIDFTSVPWARVPLAQISTDAPIRSIVLGGPNGGTVVNSALGSLSLSGLNFDKTTALGSAAFNQTATLGSQQATFDAQATTATPIKIGDLSLYNPSTQAGDLVALGVRPTVADAMSTLLDSSAMNWESADLPSLSLPEYDMSQQPGVWTASVTPAAVTGSPAGSVIPTRITMALPTGFDVISATATSLNANLVINSITRSGPNVVFDVDAPDAAAVTLTVNALGSLDIRAASSATTTVVTAAPFGGAPASATSSPTSVIQRTTVHDPLVPNVLNFDYITSANTDSTVTFTMPAPAAGTRVFALLGNLPADYDLTVYGPSVVANTSSSNPFRSLALSGFAQRPALGLNVADAVKQDPGVDNGPTTALPVSGQIAEIPLHQGTTNMPVMGVSNTTGTGPEEVGWVSDGYGSYTIVVSAKSGANSSKPFTLRVRTIDPAPAAVCKPAIPFPTAVSYPAVGFDLAAPVAAPNSPIAVIDRAAFQARYGTTDAVSLWNALVAFRTQPEGLPLRIITLDTDADYGKAAQNRQVNPCDLSQTFTEVDRASSLIRAAKAANPGATSVILVGSDEQLPMARVRDQAWTFNEAEFADEAVDSTPNPISVSAQQGFVLADTPYAISKPSLAGQGAAMIPDMGIGRLVESPTTIIGQLSSYTKYLGKLAAGTKGFSYQRYGYGFLTDGTNAIGNNLATGGGVEAAGSQVNDSWDGSTLTSGSGAFGATTSAVTVLNAHFDPRRLMPACGDPIVTPAPTCLTPLVGASAAANTSLPGKLLMSLGCHSGLNMPNGYFPAGSSLATDWAETFANAGSSVWIGNAGYGYGDSDVVAYSEQLMTNFADQLSQAPNAGLALTYAKQRYQSDLVAMSDIDQKVLAESTFYGLPLWIGTTRTAPAKATVGLTSSTATVSSVDQTVTPTFTAVTSPRGAYLTATSTIKGSVGSVAATPGFPLVPHIELPGTQTTPTIVGSRLRGVEIMSLTGSLDASVNPVISRAVVDSSVREGEPASPNTVWPASIQTASWMTTSSGDEDRIGVTPVVAIPKPGGLIDQIRFSAVGTRAYYSASGRLTPPVIQRIDVAGTNVTVTAVKSDNSADNLPIDHVSVLGWDGTAGGWVKYGPVVSAGPTFSFAGLAAATKYLYVQVVDGAGNVASTFKVVTPGIVSSAAGSTSTSGASVVGTPGKFSGPVTITATWPTGAHIKLGSPTAVDSTNPVTVTSSQNVYVTDAYSAVQKAWALSIDSLAPSLPVAGVGQVFGANGATVVVPATSSPISASAGTVVNFPTTTGDVGDGTVGVTCLPASGTAFPIGSTKVGCQAVDSAGNRTYSTFTLTVQDPYLTLPAPITAEATGSTGAPVTFTATAVDSVDGARPVSCTPASGAIFPIATTTVTCTSSDTRGYVSTGSFTVTVRDTTAPTLTLPTSVAATATGATGAVVTYSATATDKVDGARPVTCSPASGATFAVGSATVTCSAADTRLNTASGTFVVTVGLAADKTLPTVVFSPVSGGKAICKLTCGSTALNFVTADSTANSTWQTVSGVASVTYYQATTLSTVKTTPTVWSKGVAYGAKGGSVTLTNTVGNTNWVRIDVKDVAGNLTTGIWWVSA